MFWKLPKKSSSNKVAMSYGIMGTNELFHLGKMQLCVLKESRKNLTIS